MKKLLRILLCIALFIGVCAVTAYAANFWVSFHDEMIYAGGVVDLYAYPSTGNTEDYTYQWQYDAAFGDGHWYNVPENSSYSGGKTNHLRMKTSLGTYDGWEDIPFQCVVTDKDGTVRQSPNIYMYICPTDNLIPDMKAWGYGLFDPTLTNITNLTTLDNITYNGSIFAGKKFTIACGSKSIDDKPILRNSEVELNTEIHITENGKTTISTNYTSYIPYTVGKIKVEVKQMLKIGGHDLGCFDSKTINITSAKPEVIATAKTTTACSLLRYTYNESQKLASIPKGTTVNIVGKEGSYYQVYYGDYIGFVSTSLVNSYTEASNGLIKEIDVKITRPVAGKTPSYTCSILSEGVQLYKTDPITWTDASTGKALKATDTFQKGKSYTVSIWVAAKSGYRFQTDAANNPKLTGSINDNLPPYIYKAYEQNPEQVVELLYTFHNTAEHTCKLLAVLQEDATCTVAGQKEYYRCTSCGACYSDTQAQNRIDPNTWGILAPSGHTPSAWRTTGIYHYKVCTTCGDMLTEEDHFGGEATCIQPAQCTVCGYSYQEPNENHIPATEWTACSTLYHAKLCTRCGAHCDPEDHVPGPAATDTTAQTCKECGFIIEPAKNHKHDLKPVEKVEATCILSGTEAHYACSGCSELFYDAAGTDGIGKIEELLIPPFGHLASEEWCYSEEYHWRVCEICIAELDETKMVHEFEDDACLTCGYVIGGEVHILTPEGSGKFPQNPSSMDWVLPVMIAAVILAAGGTIGAVLFLKRKKKRGM